VTRSLAVVLAIVGDLIAVLFRSRAAVVAENLFLRRQLALYLERQTRRRRPSPPTKFALVMLSRFFPWASALAIVKPDTFVRWHRAGFLSVAKTGIAEDGTLRTSRRRSPRVCRS